MTTPTCSGPDSSHLAAAAPRTRVLGVDPGTRVAGFGVLDIETGRPPVLVAHGAIRLPPRPLAARLETLFRELREIIARHAPRVLAIERVFHGKNFESILKVGEARGVAVLAAQMAGLEIREYTPAMIKKSVTGNGNAEKRQVQLMMGRLLRLEEPPAPVDASDALAAAFCHGQRSWREGIVHEGQAPSRLGALLRRWKRPGRGRRPVDGPARFEPAARGARRPGRARRVSAGGVSIEDLLRSGKARVLDKSRRRSPGGR